MKPEGSVTLYLRRLQAGDQAALQRLWEGYFGRLVGLARKRLQGTPRQAADEEDVALSAFDSFHRGVEQGRFPRLADRDDLWQVLVMLTLRKASNQARHARAEVRGGGRVHTASALDLPGEEAGRAFADLVTREPDPAFAAEVTEACGALLGLLPEELREVAVWKMEGWSNEEIAARLGRHVSAAERKLAAIRAIWAKEVAE
jgi:DNA-directed RNA polymerase specialized sigma24 family protein